MLSAYLLYARYSSRPSKQIVGTSALMEVISSDGLLVYFLKNMC